MNSWSRWSEHDQVIKLICLACLRLQFLSAIVSFWFGRQLPVVLAPIWQILFLKIEIIRNTKDKDYGESIRYMYVLDRKTLELQKIQNYDKRVKYIHILRCEIDVKSKNKMEFESKFLSDGIMKYQSELDKILEKNKI